MVDKDQHSEKELQKGTPPDQTGKEADKEKLILGKYKTIEEAEKGEKEREAKFTLAHQELSDTKKKLEEKEARLKQIEKAEKEKGEKEKQLTEEEYKAMTKTFMDDMRKDPVGTLDRYIRSHPAVANRITRQDIEQEREKDKKLRENYEKFREAHKEDFDKLKGKMAEIWGKMLPEARTPEMLEVVYKAAKAETLPDEGKLREKIIKDMKAGHSEGGGEKLPPTEEKSDVDKVIEEHKKEKVL